MKAPEEPSHSPGGEEDDGDFQKECGKVKCGKVKHL
jgi:hypothetical protein